MSLAMILSLAACGSSDPAEKYYGTWEADILILGGSEYAIEEVEAIGDDAGFCDMMLVIKKGGSVYVRSGGSSDIGDWELDAENKLTIGYMEGCYIDEQGRFCLPLSEDATAILKKTSDSQTIPSN